jgi:hypothetical protein
MSDTRIPLTPKQTAFFLRHRMAMHATDAAMRGALQLIVEELGLAGRVTLSDDCTELIETDAGPVQHPANGAMKELQQ